MNFCCWGINFICFVGEATLSAACEVVAVLQVFQCVSVCGCDAVLSCVAVSYTKGRCDYLRVVIGGRLFRLCLCVLSLSSRRWSRIGTVLCVAAPSTCIVLVSVMELCLYI